MRFVASITRLAIVTIGLSVASLAQAAPPVGVTTILFDKTSATTGAPRALPTLVWYPAKAHTGIPEALGLRDAAVRPGRYPLIIYSHGACGRNREATYLTKALAARGFIVAAPPHPGNTADDPTCVAGFIDSAVNRVPDVRFVLDGMLAQASDRSSLFHRRIDTERLGITGLSFGGFTTLLAAQFEPRFDAAFSLVPGGSAALGPGGITIPTLVMGAERDQIVGYAESENVYALLHGPRYLVEILAANHLSAVDDCFNHDLNVDLCRPQDISQDDAHRLILRYALPFFQRYLRGKRPAGRQLTKQVEGVIVTAEPKPDTP
jgi:predicted dienelactone hydrolase